MMMNQDDTDELHGEELAFTVSVSINDYGYAFDIINLKT